MCGLHSSLFAFPILFLPTFPHRNKKALILSGFIKYFEFPVIIFCLPWAKVSCVGAFILKNVGKAHYMVFVLRCDHHILSFSSPSCGGLLLEITANISLDTFCCHDIKGISGGEKWVIGDGRWSVGGWGYYG